MIRRLLDQYAEHYARPGAVRASRTGRRRVARCDESEKRACEEILLTQGSCQEDIWGADWYPEAVNVDGARPQYFVALEPGIVLRGGDGVQVRGPLKSVAVWLASRS